MKAKIGLLFMVIGSVLIASALGLFLYNNWEQKQADESVDVLMPQVVEQIQQRQNQEVNHAQQDNVSFVETQPALKEMPLVQIDGHNYVGFVGIESLSLELPVMADWSYPQLKIAPCRFAGDMYQDDLVIMAHNYSCHFGQLQELRVGDAITVTDMDGVTVEYEVVALDVLEATAVEEMTSMDYDLTLFTCTYGGASRFTVRCDRVE